jgi:flagellar M-ring protein FliF
VRSAIGFDQKRGDQVEVVNLRFAEVPSNIINEPTGIMAYLQFTKEDIMQGVELAVMALLSLIVVLTVVRPLVRRIITPDKPAPVGADMMLPGAAAAAAVLASEAALPPVPSQASQMIDMAQVKGQVHAQTVQKVGELADRNPNETVSIIRAWLHDAA